jgi:hypothetical protein
LAGVFLEACNNLQGCNQEPASHPVRVESLVSFHTVSVESLISSPRSLGSPRLSADTPRLRIAIAIRSRRTCPMPPRSAWRSRAHPRCRPASEFEDRCAASTFAVTGCSERGRADELKPGNRSFKMYGRGSLETACFNIEVAGKSDRPLFVVNFTSGLGQFLDASSRCGRSRQRRFIKRNRSHARY